VKKYILLFTLFLTLAVPAVLMADGNPNMPPPTGGNPHFQVAK
jgi:hypothetical protein